ncbi:MAG: MBOAT family protein [Clostridiaceae bacterium]|nr:MBOAT family protein [Clostridiaceae bacterium]
MVFSSLVFLYGFLPLCLLVYLLSGNTKTRNRVLLVFSLAFYAWGEPVWVVLMILTGLLVYLAGLGIEKYRDNKFKSRLFLVITLIASLSSLALFKYSGFVISNLNLLPFIDLRVPKFSLPIGISFYTFQALTYAIDLYRGKTKIQRSYFDFMLYISLFPQLIAGPIVRYDDIADQIKDRKITLEDFSRGIARFLTGLAKKVLIANHAGEIVSQTIGSRLPALSSSEAWIGIIAFSLQIYFDFSGYSDMAIGLGSMFGFRFKENFNYPYIASSITDFWRRWHISLSTFFRDYLYIPLGGNKHHQIRNMFIVWALTGLWHGASWNFVFWGLYFFIFLTVEKLFLGKILAKLPAVVSHIYALLIVVFGWVFFYFSTLGEIRLMLTKMFFAGSTAFDIRAQILLQNEFVFLLIAMILTTPLLKNLGARLSKLHAVKTYHPAYTIIVIIVNIGILFFATAALAGSSFNPFLYFRF